MGAKEVGRSLKSVAQKLSCRYTDGADNLEHLKTSFREKYSASVKEKQYYSTIFGNLSEIPEGFMLSHMTGV